MKKLLLILLCLPMIGFGQNVYIPDANFKAYLVGNSLINTNGDSEIQVSEAATFNGEINCSNMNISDLTGIEEFTALTELHCNDNQITTLDLSNNTALFGLWCENSQLTTLYFTSNTVLARVYIRDNQLTTLDVSNMTSLYHLWCENNPLTTLDVSGDTALQHLSSHLLLGNNQLTNLDASNTIIKDWYFTANTFGTNIQWLNFSNNDNLESVDLSSLSLNSATTLVFANNTSLKTIDISNNQLECFDISDIPSLENFDCSNNLLEQLNTRNGNFLNLDVNALNNNLTCVEVDNIGVATNDWDFDGFATFNTNCNYANPCASVTTIQEHTTNKELLKVTDLLGRETKQTNQPLFYIYDDGTVEKRIVIE